MSSVIAVSSAASRVAPGRGLSRLAIAAVGAFGILAASSSAVSAQTVPAKRWEVNVPGGKLIPTGAQRDAIKGANLTAVQVSYVVNPMMVVTGMVGWARSRDVASLDEPKLDVFTYDLGAEMRTPEFGDAIKVRSFAGLGAGARSYNYRSLPVDATHNFAGYGSAGAEIGKQRVTLRLEARDYVSGFKALDGLGSRDTRNDVVLMAGLRINWR